jgi:hypothetical protein
MFVPIILGSDKTTVSIGTGHSEYYPLYLSIGNLHNNVRRAHRGGVALIAFLAIAKSKFYLASSADHSDVNGIAADRQHSNSAQFRNFRRQLFHDSLARILSTLGPGMVMPEVVRCADGHFRRAIYGLGPYIADYPEQVLIASIVQNWCPRYVHSPAHDFKYLSQ